MFISVSDGAEYAGVGRELNFGWTRENIARFASANYLPQNSAKTTAGSSPTNATASTAASPATTAPWRCCACAGATP